MGLGCRQADEAIRARGGRAVGVHVVEECRFVIAVIAHVVDGDRGIVSNRALYLEVHFQYSGALIVPTLLNPGVAKNSPRSGCSSLNLGQGFPFLNPFVRAALDTPAVVNILLPFATC